MPAATATTRVAASTRLRDKLTPRPDPDRCARTDASASPRCAIEQAVSTVLRHLAVASTGGRDAENAATTTATAGPSPVGVGCEWWVQRRGTSDGMNFHFDTDMCRQDRTAAIRCPWMSSVFYLGDAGGPTVILDQTPGTSSGWWFGLGLGTDSVALVPEEVDELDLVYPRANQYAVFRGNQLHGVLAPAVQVGTQPSAPTPSPSPSPSPEAPGADGDAGRLTLLVNYWLLDGSDNGSDNGDGSGKPEAPCCTPTSDAMAAFLNKAGVEALAAAGGGPAHKGEGAPPGDDAGPAPHRGSARGGVVQEAVHVDLSMRAEQDLAEVHTDVVVGETTELPTAFYIPGDASGELSRAGLVTLSGMGRVRVVRGFYDEQ